MYKFSLKSFARSPTKMAAVIFIKIQDVGIKDFLITLSKFNIFFCFQSFFFIFFYICCNHYVRACGFVQLCFFFVFFFACFSFIKLSFLGWVVAAQHEPAVSSKLRTMPIFFLNLQEKKKKFMASADFHYTSSPIPTFLNFPHFSTFHPHLFVPPEFSFTFTLDILWPVILLSRLFWRELIHNTLL